MALWAVLAPVLYKGIWGDYVAVPISEVAITCKILLSGYSRISYKFSY